jgi:hypothetical protein
VSEFLIWSNQHGMWWRPNRRGYTQIIDEAGRYSADEAEAIVRQATVDGALRHTRRNPITGDIYEMFDEVAVPEPVITGGSQ